MTKHELSQLYWINKEIERNRKKLEQLEAQAEKVTSTLSKTTVCGGKSDTIGDIACDIADVKDLIRLDTEKLKIALIRLYKYITTIDDSLMRQIITLRYVELKSWLQVAQALGGGNTPDSVRKAHDRYLIKK